MSTTTAATPSMATPTGSSSPPNGDASTLLFGFLVSALSIFAAFMTFAVVWNRLIARRHAIEATLATSSAGSSRVRQPVMWDIWIGMPDKHFAPSWLGLKPVAAQKCGCPPSPPRTTQTEQTPSFWRRNLLNRLPPEIAYLFYQPISPTPIPPTTPASSDTDALSQVDLSYGSDIQLSLLIIMPHALHSTRKEESHPVLHEMVLATMIVPYHDPASS